MEKNKNATVIGATAICIAASLWGLDGVVLTPNLQGLDVGFVVFMFHAIPFFLMNLVFFREYRLLAGFRAGDYAGFSLIALFGGAIGTLALVKALFLVNFDNLSIIVILQKLQPVFGIALAAILLKEKLRKDFAFWALLAVVAGYFLTFGFGLPNIQGSDNLPHAALLALLAAFSFACGTVIGKKMLYKYAFGSATFYRFGFTALLMLFYVLLARQTGEIHHVTRKQWLVLAVIAFTTGSGAIYLYYYGLTRVKAMVAIVCELCMPICAVLLDHFVNKTTFTPVQWGSAAVMIFAITQISRQKGDKNV